MVAREPRINGARRGFLATSAGVLSTTIVACQSGVSGLFTQTRSSQPYGYSTATQLNLDALVIDPVSGQSGYALGTGLNPTFVWQRGQRISGRLRNHLPQPISLHWHGLHVPSAMDGDGSNPFLPDTYGDFDFTVTNPSGLYWYHAHPHYLTAEQVYHGLAGLIVVQDDEDQAVSAALGVSLGREDLALKLQDVSLLSEHWLPFRARGKLSEAARLGTHVSVNDAIAPTFPAAPGWLRLRLLNASAARGLCLVLQGDGGQAQPLHLLGTDGGLLAAPIECEKLFLYPGERVDVAVFLPVGSGSKAAWQMTSDEFDPRRFAGSPAIAGDDAAHRAIATWPSLGGDSLCLSEPPAVVPDGARLPLFGLTTYATPLRAGALPRSLSTAITAMNASSDAPAHRRFTLGMNSTGQWLINEQASGVRLAPFAIKNGASEVWEIQNSPISVPHPMHVHGFSFEVLSRHGLYGPAKALAKHSASRMATDLGRKDTITVWPGERVRIRTNFTHRFSGAQRYLLHCHNLDHEDAMMMLPFEVSA